MRQDLIKEKRDAAAKARRLAGYLALETDRAKLLKAAAELEAEAEALERAPPPAEKLGRRAVSAAELRAQASRKRAMADMVRRVGSGLSVSSDRQAMLRHAQELEAEAAGLEARAEALDRAESK
jgi:pyruvate/2-oxoglutarate dehydrogenase complex dihydrolipoamide acyltransferase (E2) component